MTTTETKRSVGVIGILIGILGYFFLLGLQIIMHPYTTNGLYFQKWSSEILMQTVSLADLQASPFAALWNIHIQPPMFDVIRAILVQLWAASNLFELVRHVDQLIYQLWMVLYGTLGLLIFSWLSKLMETKIAVVLTFAFLLHPATISFATLLDSTFLSTVLITWLFYLLWKIKNGYSTSTISLSLVFLAVFFTRSIFQLPAIFLFAVSLLFFKVSKRDIFLFLLIAGGLSGLYLAKQFVQFDLLTTSSFSGLNLTRSVGQYPVDYWTYDLPALGKERKQQLPTVLTRKYKITGTPNFNAIGYLQLNRSLTEEYTQFVSVASASMLAASYLENFTLYFLPSSQYTENVIVKRLFWRPYYDAVFSAPVFPILLFASGVLWLLRSIRRKDYGAIGLLLPGIYIFFVCIFFEKGENMRFKYFLEPIYFISIAFYSSRLVQRIWCKIAPKEMPSLA